MRSRSSSEFTEGTVKVYLHGVFEKLGVSSRTELAIRADEFWPSDLVTTHPSPRGLSLWVSLTWRINQ